MEEAAPTEVAIEEAAPTRGPLKEPADLVVTVGELAEELTPPQVQCEE